MEDNDISEKVKQLEEVVFIGSGKPSIIERMARVEDRLASLDASIGRLTSAVNKVALAVVMAVVGALLKLVLQ